MKITASGHITSWQIDGETMEIVTDFILGGSKITADGDCSHEIKRRLLLGRKVMTNLDSILKSRDVTLPTKVCLVKAMVFPVVMCGCESWTELSWVQKNWCFWTVVLEKTQVSWTARISNQFILKEISPEYSLEGLMLKVKLQHFGHLNRRTDSSEKTLILGKIEGRRRRGWQRMRWLVGTTDSVEMSLSRLRKLVMDREAWCAVVMRSQRVGHDWATELNWTDWWMRELDHKESWALNNWCFRAVVLEKIFESPLENKDIKPVNLKGNQPGIFFERTDAEAEAPVLWPLDLYSWLIGKDHDARKDWRQKEKRVIEDDGMVAWHHGFTGHELGQTLGDC